MKIEHKIPQASLTKRDQGRGMSDTHTWQNLILRTRLAVGTAARHGRGRHTGQKVHQLRIEECVGVVDPAIVKKGTVGAQFLKYGKPALFSTMPLCGCTTGQHAGMEITGITIDQVTCVNCMPVSA